METTTATATKKKEENTFVRQKNIFFSLVVNSLVLFFALIACNPGKPTLKCLSPCYIGKGVTPSAE